MYMFALDRISTSQSPPPAGELFFKQQHEAPRHSLPIHTITPAIKYTSLVFQRFFDDAQNERKNTVHAEFEFTLSLSKGSMNDSYG